MLLLSASLLAFNGIEQPAYGMVVIGTTYTNTDLYENPEDIDVLAQSDKTRPFMQTTRIGPHSGPLAGAAPSKIANLLI